MRHRTMKKQSMEARIQQSRTREEATMKSSFSSHCQISKPFEEKEEAQIFSSEEERAVVTENKSAEKLERNQSMDINESAEAFIKKFRQQLLIQRLESMENFEKMLERGL